MIQSQAKMMQIVHEHERPTEDKETRRLNERGRKPLNSSGSWALGEEISVVLLICKTTKWEEAAKNLAPTKLSESRQTDLTPFPCILLTY